jgi:signal transduction histidine kinase
MSTQGGKRGLAREKGRETGCQEGQVLLDLIALLDERRQEIAVDWAEVIHQEMPDTFYGQRPLDEIVENDLVALDMLKDVLRGADSLPTDLANLPEPSAYLRQGMPVTEFMQAAWLCKQVLTPIVTAAFPPDSPGGPEALHRMEAGVAKFAALVVGEYAALLTQYNEEQHRRTELMLDMARAVSASLELKDVLRRAARGIASAAGGIHSSICLIEDDNVTGTLWAGTETLSPVQLRFLGPAGQRAVNLSESTFVRRVLDEKKVVIWPDVQNDPTVGDDIRSLGLRSVIGVPCAVTKRILAVAFVIDTTAPSTFTPDQIELALGVANVVAPAIENARLHQKVAQLAVAEERARLAQEIHDQLAQTMGAMQFYVSLIDDLLAQQQFSQAQAGLSVLHGMIDQANVDVREAIFNLRSMASLQVCGLAALQTYLAAYEQRYGLTVDLHADEEAAGVLVGETGLHAFRILQEALTNVRKHGKTCCARVGLEREGAWVRISVLDEGEGFDPATVNDLDPKGFGLQVMRERAEKIGGTLSVVSQPGQGTSLVLRVPYPQKQGPA